MSVVHLCPRPGSGVTPCCGRTPFELSHRDRLTSDRAFATCGPVKRRGVHHSGGLRAKRRWLKWRRYQRRCDALAGAHTWTLLALAPRMPHVMLDGYSWAAWRWAYIGRYAPIGIRDVRA